MYRWGYCGSVQEGLRGRRFAQGQTVLCRWALSCPSTRRGIGSGGPVSPQGHLRRALYQLSRSAAECRSGTWLASSPRCGSPGCRVALPCARQCLAPSAAHAGSSTARNSAAPYRLPSTNWPYKRPYGNIGDAVCLTAQVATFGQAPVKHIELALGFHGEAVDGVLELLRRVHRNDRSRHPGRAPLPSARTAASSGTRCAQQALSAAGRRTFLPGTTGSSRTRRLAPVVPGCSQQCGDLGVWVDLNEAAGKLVAFADADQPGIVFRASVAEFKQLFQGNGDLHAVGCGQGIQLQRLLALGQVLVMGRAGDGRLMLANWPRMQRQGARPWWHVEQVCSCMKLLQGR